MMVRTTWCLPFAKRHISSIKSLQLKSANCKVVNMESIGPLLIRTGDHAFAPDSGIVENLTFDVLLRALFIDRCICSIFPTQLKVFLFHFRAVKIISTKRAINSIFPDITVPYKNSKRVNGAVSENHYLFCAALQISIPAYTQAAALVGFQGAGLMTVETHGNVVGPRCSMTAQCVMDILPGMLLYLYVLNIRGKPASLCKVMIVGYASNA